MRFPSNIKVAVQRAMAVTNGVREGPAKAGPPSSASSSDISSAAMALATAATVGASTGLSPADASRPADAQEEEGNSAVPTSLQLFEEEANRKIAGGPTQIEVSRDESTGRFVLRVLDKATGTVLRQFPPETTLRVSEKLSELSGMLFADDA